MNSMRYFSFVCSTVLQIMLFGHATLQAQISITQGSFESSLQQETPVTEFLSEDGERIFDLIGISGADRVWDFSGLEIFEERDGFFSVLSTTEELPGESDQHLGNANMVTMLDFPIYNPEIGEGAIFYEIGYGHVRLDDGIATLLGEVWVEGDDINEDREDEHYITWLDPGQTWLDFPVTYLKNWESSYEVSYSDVFITIDVDEETEVDGWGTLITSGGSFDVLRIRRVFKSRLFGVIQGDVEVFEFYDATGRRVAIITGFFPTFDEDYDELEAKWYEFSSPTIISDGESRELPSGILLHQNYPNPFNPSTTIVFQLPEAADILLTVHDLLGREVAMLAQGPAAAGEHSFVFDASSLPGGVYMYRLATSDRSVTRKLTLVK